jgi:hypothetical protein
VAAATLWIGTAPICKAQPKDCADRNMVYVRSHARGDGELCQTGLKVLCQAK